MADQKNSSELRAICIETGNDKLRQFLREETPLDSDSILGLFEEIVGPYEGFLSTDDLDFIKSDITDYAGMLLQHGSFYFGTKNE